MPQLPFKHEKSLYDKRKGYKSDIGRSGGLIPGLSDVFAAAKEAGAYNAIISGAGSTVMAYASPEADCERIAKAMVDVFAANNEHACYHILDLDTDGVKKV